MPEMLKPTSLIMGAGLGKDVAFVTDGRFSGGSHGFVVGHVTPEAMAGGRIGLVKTGDRIKIDAENNTIDHLVDQAVLKKRKRVMPPREGLSLGWLKLYSLNVDTASNGCTLGIRRDMRHRIADFRKPSFRVERDKQKQGEKRRERTLGEKHAQKVARKEASIARIEGMRRKEEQRLAQIEKDRLIGRKKAQPVYDRR
jgi:dihydroxy-acid dehydratase